MIIREKSVGTLQAQAAGFAAELVADWRMRDTLYENLGDMSVLSEMYDTEPHLRSDYIDFLRHTMRTGAAALKGRVEMAAAYETFSEPVGGLLAELEPITTFEGRVNHPAYLGSGSFSDVFRMQHAGRNYAVKLPRLPVQKIDTSLAISDAERADHYAMAACRGRGIRRLEQVAAISYAAGVVVSELMPGKCTKDMTVSERSAIKDEHIIQLAATLKLAEAAGVVADIRSKGNLLYHPEAGFGLLDYLTVEHPLLRREDKEPVLPRLIGVLCFKMLDDPRAGGAYFELSSRVRDIFVDQGFTEEESDEFVDVA